MPNQKETGKTDKTPDNSILNTSIDKAKSEPTNPHKDEIRSAKRTTTKQKEKENTIVVNITRPDPNNSHLIEANSIAKGAKKISFWSTIVNFCLFIVTLALAGVAFYQYQSGKTAAEIARETLKETKKYDSISLKKQKEAFDRQIKVFNIENEPYLEVADWDTIQMNDGQHMRFIFRIAALGNRPVQGVTESYNLVPVPYFDTLKFIKKPFSYLRKPNKSFNYFTKEKPASAGLESVSPVYSIKAAYQGRLSNLYLVGRIEYINYVNNKKRKYEFVIKFAYFNGKTHYSYLVNNNTDE